MSSDVSHSDNQMGACVLKVGSSMKEEEHQPVTWSRTVPVTVLAKTPTATRVSTCGALEYWELLSGVKSQPARCQPACLAATPSVWRRFILHPNDCRVFGGVEAQHLCSRQVL